MNAPQEFDRAKWLKERKKRLGATDVSAIVGVSPYTTSWDVWADKTELITEWVGNSSTTAGTFVERSILDFAESQLGPLERNIVVHHPTLPVASTLDARTAEGKPVESKTTGLTGPVVGEWGDADTDEVPPHYRVQVDTQLLCTNADYAWLYALIGGRGFVRYYIPRDNERMLWLALEIESWWDKHIIQGIEPERNFATFDTVKRIKKTEGKTIELPSDVQLLLDQKDILDKEAKAIGEKLDACKKMILLALGDAEIGTLPDSSLVTYKQINKKGFTVAPTSYRQLRVSRPKVK